VIVSVVAVKAEVAVNMTSYRTPDAFCAVAEGVTETPLTDEADAAGAMAREAATVKMVVAASALVMTRRGSTDLDRRSCAPGVPRWNPKSLPAILRETARITATPFTTA
jgi:hypothetical protein